MRGDYAFSEMAIDPKLDIDLSMITAVGQHVVNATLYGTTLQGRELKITLPAKTFNIFPPPPPPEPVVVTPVASSAAATDEVAEKQGISWLVWVLAGGGVLLAVILGGVGFVVVQKRRA